MNKDAVAQWKSIWLVIWWSKVRPQPVLKSFSKTLPENSGGAENSTEILGTNGINFFCYMYESSLRNPVWVPEINVKACNNGWKGWELHVLMSLNRHLWGMGIWQPHAWANFNPTPYEAMIWL